MFKEYVGIDSYELKNEYRTHGTRQKVKVDEQISVKLEDEDILTNLNDTDWNNEDIIYEIYNENEVVRYIDHGM